jgi:hypothetical protein
MTGRKRTKIGYGDIATVFGKDFFWIAAGAVFQTSDEYLDNVVAF